MDVKSVANHFDTRRHAVIRVVWLTTVSITIGLAGLGVYVNYRALQFVCYEPATCVQLQLNAEAAQILSTVGVTLQTYATFIVIIGSVQLIVPLLAAVLIFIRKSSDWLALLLSFGLVMICGYVFVGTGFTLARVYPQWTIPLLLWDCVGLITLFTLYFVFPDERFVPAWTRWLVLPMACVVIVSWLTIAPLYSTPKIFFFSRPIAPAVAFFAGGVALLAQVYRYRHAQALQRQQIKWVIFGLFAPITGGATVLLIAIAPEPISSLFGVIAPLVATSFSISLPLALTFSILRFHLWDIDIIIRRTLIYAVLTTILAAVYFGSVVLVQQLIRAATGQSSDLAIVISTLAIAALFTPLRRRTQAIIDRRLYRRKYDTEKTLAAFGQNLRNETDLETLKTQLIGVVQETLQPSKVTLWIREVDSPAVRSIVK